MLSLHPKKFWQRAISATLFIFILFLSNKTIFPSASAEYVTPSIIAEYKFYNGAYSGETDTNARTYTSYTDARKWAYVADTASQGNTVGALTRLSTGLQSVTEFQEWVAIKITVPATGQYRASLNYRCMDAGAITRFYYIPYTSESAWTTSNIPNYLNSTYLKGEMDMRTGTAGSLNTLNLSDVYLNEGEYLLVYRAEGSSKSPATYYYMYPRVLTLTGCQLDSVSLNVSNDNISVGDSTSSSITALMNSGNSADLNNATVTYTSSNTSVASVDSTSGQITALSAGQTDITASVTLAGVTKTSVKTISVYDEYSAQSVAISGTDSMYVGKQYQMTLIATLRNGSKCTIPCDTATFSVVESVPSGTVEVLNNGIVAGSAAGTAKLRASGTYRGLPFVSGDFSVTVEDVPDAAAILGYDFRLNAYPGDTLTDGRQYTQYTEARPWAYIMDTFTQTSSSGTAIDLFTNRMQIVSRQNEWVAFKIRVPYSGRYHANFSYYGRDRAGIIDMYTAPLPANPTQDAIIACMTPSNKAASIDTYKAVTGVYQSSLEDYYFKQSGEYLFIMKTAGKNASSLAYNMYPATLNLTGDKALSSASISLASGLDEIGINQTGQLICNITCMDNSTSEAAAAGAAVTYSSSNTAVASVDSSGIVTGNAIGNADITAAVTLNGITKTTTKNICITDYSDIVSISLTGSDKIYVGKMTQLSQEALLESGNKIPVPVNTMTYTVVSCVPSGAATLSSSGLITGVDEGVIQVKGTSTYRGSNIETPVFSVTVGYSLKTRSTIWTVGKRNAAQQNKLSYTWAQTEINNIVDDADDYVDSAETLWNMVVPEGLPRFYYAGDRNDPEKFHCRYCGADLLSSHGVYPWRTDPINNPWKIQCPVCLRQFPSNDFASYYASGLDSHGVFNSTLAQQNGQEYLTNELYPEKGDGWGVDDGFGYFPGHTYENEVVERHNYIAYYIYMGLWHGSGTGTIQDAINKLALAYVYTGDARYGRTGAIILDRVADFYPNFDWYQWHTFHSDSYRGKIADPVYECTLTQTLAKAYDAFYPIYTDPQVISFLSQKSTQYQMDNPKNTAGKIRANAENGILREIYQACLKGKVAGNFGLTQASITAAALALDTMPETKEWLDWMMRPGSIENTGDPSQSDDITGGNVSAQLVDKVNRDGMGNEASPKYNMLWIRELLDAAEMLGDYDGYADVNLYNNPKFAKMFTAQLPLIMASYYTEQNGDSGLTAGNEIIMDKSTALLGFKRLGNPQLAQFLYFINGNSVSGIHEDVTDTNPEQIQQDITSIINQYGTFNPGSGMMTGYGFAALRDGIKTDSVNNQQDFYIYFGRGLNHGHSDCLNLGIDAYGLNMAPDLGYPEQTNTQPNRIQWIDTTLSHNTVVIDGRGQDEVESQGKPLHFDDAGQVKVMDIDATQAYDQTSIYRRTVVMVKANDDVSYGVDFFRIHGGNDHIYSFHSQSDEIYETSGLTLVPQVDGNNAYVGTYAGANVLWGEDPFTDLDSWDDDYLQYMTGSTWLDAVRRDTAPPQTFAVDFKVKDFRNILPGDPNLHLRMTMLNNFNLSEVAVAHGTPPRIGNNMSYMSYLEYVLARRTGTNLDSLFTTVYEPYNDARYLQSIATVDTSILQGTQGSTDTVKAVKVTHTSGRIDYIVYATNNTVEYRVDNLFDFRGFVGVYTLTGGTPTYSYVNDGDIIGSSTGILPAYTGVVENFTQEMQSNNTITIEADQQVDPSALTGKYVYITNTGSPKNGVYKILSANAVTGNEVELNIGDVSLIRAYQDDDDTSAGYVYNITAGQAFKIPLSATPIS